MYFVWLCFLDCLLNCSCSKFISLLCRKLSKSIPSVDIWMGFLSCRDAAALAKQSLAHASYFPSPDNFDCFVLTKALPLGET